VGLRSIRRAAYSGAGYVGLLAGLEEVISVNPADVIKLIAAIAGVITSAKSAVKYARRLGLT